MTDISIPVRKHVARKSPVWQCIIADDEWTAYLDAIHAARKSRARFLLGGAFGLAAYTGRCRNTKDIDFFVLPSEKDKLVDALTKAGFDDYYPTLAYDRGWIYRGTRDGMIVDVIWQTPNRRTQVDEAWFERARELVLRGEELRVIPAEELLAIKAYVLQRDRCDWPDLINLLYATGPVLDWNHVIRRMEAELPLITGLLHVYNWAAPQEALKLPDWVREKFHLQKPGAAELALDPRHRVDLLDSRPWFAAFQPPDEAMPL